MGAHLTLQIDSLAHGGAGVARDAEGRIVFVRGACPGDEVEAVVVAERKRHQEANVLRVLSQGPARVTPPCPYFGRCGGCQWQHIAVDAQRASKRSIVRDSLERIGRIADPDVHETIGTGDGYGYRNKVEFNVAADEQGRPLLGMREAGTERIVPIDECLLLPQKTRSLPRTLTDALAGLSKGADLGLSRVVAKVASNATDIEIDLWGPPGRFPRQAAADAVRKAVPGCDTVALVRIKDAARDRSRAKAETLAGRGNWRERLSGFEYRVSPTSFFQVNTAATEALVTLVLSDLAPTADDRVLDLYSGVGTFTLPLARIAKEVVAVDTSETALRDLEYNLENNLDSTSFEATLMPGDAARAVVDAGAFDLIVADPPRAGLAAEAIKGLAAALPRRFVYISCDPATMARDAKRLAAEGLELVRATPVDLFPQTFHTETVAVFEQRA